MKVFYRRLLLYSVLWVGGWVVWAFMRLYFGFLLPWPDVSVLPFISEIIISVCFIAIILIVVKESLGNLDFITNKKSYVWLVLPYILLLFKMLIEPFTGDALFYYERLVVFTFVMVCVQQVINFGFLYDVLVKRYSKTQTMMLAAVGFTLPHITMVFHTSVLYAVFWSSVAFFGGLVFAWLRKRSASIYPSFSVHWSFYLLFGLFFELPIY